MTENNAAQPGQDPLTDQFVNAVIRQHGYSSPEAVIARLWQWIGLNGGENSVTLLMYEAHKALSKLRAEGVQAGDARAAFLLEEALGYIRSFSIPGKTAEDMTAIAQAGMRRFTAALASAPVAGEAVAGEAVAGYMVGTDYFRPDVLAAARIYAENRNLTVRTLRYADAAPQASEAVRDAALEEAATFLENNRKTWLSVRAAYEIRALKSPRHNSDSRSAVESITCAVDAALPPLPPADLTADPGGDAWPFPKVAYFNAASMTAYARAALPAQPAQKQGDGNG